MTDAESEPTTRGTYGDGSIRTRADGRLEKRLSLGVDPATGRYVRKSAYGWTKRELQRNAKKIQLEWEKGQANPSSRDTLDDYFVDWLERKRVEITDRTALNYEREYDRYLKPHLGGVRLDPARLNEDRVTAWHSLIAKEHGAYTANRSLSLLGNILRDHRVMRSHNPTVSLRGAKHEQDPVEILTAEELGIFLPAAARTRLRNMFAIGLAAGLRHGEATGLAWRDVTIYRRPAANGDYGELHVRQAVVLDRDGKRVLGRPKSPSAIRTIGLMPEAAEALELQRELLEAEGLGGHALVFPASSGQLQPETNTSRALRGVIDACNPRLMEWIHERRARLRSLGRTADQARQEAWQHAQALPDFEDLLDVKYVSFHDLRHTFASMLIAAGRDAPFVSRALGHSDPAFTMRKYVHFFERAQRLGMPSMSQFVPSLGPIWGKDRGTAVLEAERIE